MGNEESGHSMREFSGVMRHATVVPDDVDLSGLTAEERAIIESVMAKAKEDIPMPQQCPLCLMHDTDERVRCVDCARAVCIRCGHNLPAGPDGTSQIWVCNECGRRRPSPLVQHNRHFGTDVTNYGTTNSKSGQCEDVSRVQSKNGQTRNDQSIGTHIGSIQSETSKFGQSVNIQPVNTQPVNTHPINTHPVNTQPVIGHSGTGQIIGGQSGSNQFSGNSSGNSQFEISQSGTNKFGAEQSGTVQFGSGQYGMNQFGRDQSSHLGIDQTSKLGIGQSSIGQFDSGHLGTNQSGIDQSGHVDSGQTGSTKLGQSGSGQFGSSQSGTNQLGIGQFGSGQSGIGQFGNVQLNQISSGQSATGQFGNSQSGNSKFGNNQPGAVQFGSGQSGNGQFGTSQYGINQFGSGQQGINQFGSGQQGISQFGTGQSGISHIGIDQTGVSNFGTGQSGSGQQGISQVGISQMGSGQQGISQVGISQMGSSQSGTSHVGIGQSGVSQFGQSNLSHAVIGQTGTVPFGNDQSGVGIGHSGSSQFGSGQTGMGHVGSGQSGVSQTGHSGTGQSVGGQFGSVHSGQIKSGHSGTSQSVTGQPGMSPPVSGQYGSAQHKSGQSSGGQFSGQSGVSQTGIGYSGSGQFNSGQSGTGQSVIGQHGSGQFGNVQIKSGQFVGQTTERFDHSGQTQHRQSVNQNENIPLQHSTGARALPRALERPKEEQQYRYDEERDYGINANEKQESNHWSAAQSSREYSSDLDETLERETFGDRISDFSAHNYDIDEDYEREGEEYDDDDDDESDDCAVRSAVYTIPEEEEEEEERRETMRGPDSGQWSVKQPSVAQQRTTVVVPQQQASPKSSAPIPRTVPLHTVTQQQQTSPKHKSGQHMQTPPKKAPIQECWSPPSDLSPILDVSPSVEAAEQEMMEKFNSSMPRATSGTITGMIADFNKAIEALGSSPTDEKRKPTQTLIPSPQVEQQLQQQQILIQQQQQFLQIQLEQQKLQKQMQEQMSIQQTRVAAETEKDKQRLMQKEKELTIVQQTMEEKRVKKVDREVSAMTPPASAAPQTIVSGIQTKTAKKGRRLPQPTTEEAQSAVKSLTTQYQIRSPIAARKSPIHRTVPPPLPAARVVPSVVESRIMFRSNTPIGASPGGGDNLSDSQSDSGSYGKGKGSKRRALPSVPLDEDPISPVLAARKLIKERLRKPPLRSSVSLDSGVHHHHRSDSPGGGGSQSSDITQFLSSTYGQSVLRSPVIGVVKSPIRSPIPGESQISHQPPFSSQMKSLKQQLWDELRFDDRRRFTDDCLRRSDTDLQRIGGEKYRYTRHVSDSKLNDYLDSYRLNRHDLRESVIPNCMDANSNGMDIYMTHRYRRRIESRSWNPSPYVSEDEDSDDQLTRDEKACKVRAEIERRRQQLYLYDPYDHQYYGYERDAALLRRPNYAHPDETDAIEQLYRTTPVAMPILPDMPTRSRKLLEDLGAERYGFRGPKKTQFAAPNAVRNPKYPFPVKRILLTQDSRSSGLGLKVIGGREIHGTNMIGAFISHIHPSLTMMGEIREGMQVIEWNGIPLTGINATEVQRIIETQTTDEIEVVIRDDVTYPHVSLQHNHPVPFVVS